MLITPKTKSPGPCEGRLLCQVFAQGRGLLTPGRWWRRATSAGLGALHPEQPT